MSEITKTTDDLTASIDLTAAIDVFLEELPNPVTSMQSFFLKELSVDDKKVTLLAQKRKGSKGMTWSVNVSKYKHN